MSQESQERARGTHPTAATAALWVREVLEGAVFLAPERVVGGAALPRAAEADLPTDRERSRDREGQGPVKNGETSREREREMKRDEEMKLKRDETQER